MVWLAIAWLTIILISNGPGFNGPNPYWLDFWRLGPVVSKSNKNVPATHQQLYQESQEVLA